MGTSSSQPEPPPQQVLVPCGPPPWTLCSSGHELNYDACDSCYQGLPPQRVLCSRGHYLTGSYVTNHTCDRCGVRFGAGVLMFLCVPCGFDACSSCYHGRREQGRGMQIARSPGAIVKQTTTTTIEVRLDALTCQLTSAPRHALARTNRFHVPVCSEGVDCQCILVATRKHVAMKITKVGRMRGLQLKFKLGQSLRLAGVSCCAGWPQLEVAHRRAATQLALCRLPGLSRGQTRKPPARRPGPRFPFPSQIGNQGERELGISGPA
jgi:hypothetical protein